MGLPFPFGLLCRCLSYKLCRDCSYAGQNSERHCCKARSEDSCGLRFPLFCNPYPFQRVRYENASVNTRRKRKDMADCSAVADYHADFLTRNFRQGCSVPFKRSETKNGRNFIINFLSNIDFYFSFDIIIMG